MLCVVCRVLCVFGACVVCVVSCVVLMIQETACSVQARSCGQALDDEELFIIEGSPGAQLRDIRRRAKNATFHGKKPIPDVIRAAC